MPNQEKPILPQPPLQESTLAQARIMDNLDTLLIPLIVARGDQQASFSEPLHHQTNGLPLALSSQEFIDGSPPPAIGNPLSCVAQMDQVSQNTAGQRLQSGLQ